MGGFDPIYDCDETEGLTEEQKRILREAVLHQLNTSAQIRKLLRRKTSSVYNKLTSKKRKTPSRRKLGSSSTSG
jgi:hypothetical protein